jgi:pyruvate kinase
MSRPSSASVHASADISPASLPKIADYSRRCRIIATIGPASNPLEMIRAGATCFRLNFSHGSHEEHKARIDLIREAEKASGRFVPLMADLQGPKIRVGTFEGDGITLKYGQEVTLELSKEAGREGLIRLPHPEIMSVLQVGDAVKLDDGEMSLTIIEKLSETLAKARVECGGFLKQKKGVNVPSRQLPISAMTEKDKRDLAFALEQGVDIIALSFVQTPEDVMEAKAIVQGRALVLSKIEKPQAVEIIDEIVAVSDMIMVARGDLGVELPAEHVPMAQRAIVRSCRRAGKPVVVATQMLQTMVDSPVPTRAEASDVATAVYMGADAVMLSAESAVGRHPATVVATMDRIIRAVEADEQYWEDVAATQKHPIATASNALCASARDIATLMHAKAIFAFTSSGSTAFAAARERSRTLLYAMTPDAAVARRLTMVWGVTPVVTPFITSFDAMLEWSEACAKQSICLKEGENVLVLAGTPFGVPGSTNTLKVMTL